MMGVMASWSMEFTRCCAVAPGIRKPNANPDNTTQTSVFFKFLHILAKMRWRPLGYIFVRIFRIITLLFLMLD
jgi:hypothetical protein